MRYGNCGLSDTGFLVYGAIGVVLCFASFSINLYVSRRTLRGSLLRYLSLSASLTNLFNGGMLIDLVVNIKFTPASIVFLLGCPGDGSSNLRFAIFIHSASSK